MSLHDDCPSAVIEDPDNVLSKEQNAETLKFYKEFYAKIQEAILPVLVEAGFPGFLSEESVGSLVLGAFSALGVNLALMRKLSHEEIVSFFRRSADEYEKKLVKQQN